MIRPSARLASVVVALGPAAAVRRRSRHGAGRAGPDVELAEVVDPGDAAAALADLDEVDDRHQDRVAGRHAAALDPVVGDDLELATLDQRALRGRPADVERKHVGLADQPAELGGAPEAACRAGLDHRDRDRMRLLDRVDAAIGLHDVELPAEPALAARRRRAGQVALGDRLHVGGQHGRARALVFAPLARDLVRGDDQHLRPQLAHPRRAPPARARGLA